MTSTGNFSVADLERLKFGPSGGKFNRLRRAGNDRMALANSVCQAVDLALEWARPGDLLLLLIHEERAAILDRMRALVGTTRAE